MELDLFFVREKVHEQTLQVRHVPAQDQIADILTKPLSHSFFTNLRNRLGVTPWRELELTGNVKATHINDSGIK